MLWVIGAFIVTIVATFGVMIEQRFFQTVEEETVKFKAVDVDRTVR